MVEAVYLLVGREQRVRGAKDNVSVRVGPQ